MLRSSLQIFMIISSPTVISSRVPFGRTPSPSGTCCFPDPRKSDGLFQAPLCLRGRAAFKLQLILEKLQDNEDWMFSDLYPVEDGLSHLLPPHPFTHEDLQVAVPSPRLDAPLLPLKQSDMCLVCIAFASWVLKTANPQVGDAWKAVLLANVSALSAIRYLRKYVKDTAASEGHIAC
ncbi:hypothetical protein fugu_007437 [Takifugu bimaculatus]|uniref:Uncharacterized protein n=1 Tax=Takifugu bimaculatus TaxID=433685 RepID=A0A4Z2B4Y3_9TELE|nr:hypothetical protein fugu_007437 [Takifugu bimaculatus]